MTGIKNLLVDIKNHSTSYVTFGDGAKGEIKGVGKLDCSGVPNLEGVLLVKGLTANLISISQLCDDGYQVNFTKADYSTVCSKEKNTRTIDSVNDVVDMDNLDDPIDIADDELISSISHRVKTRKGKQVGDQHLSKTKTAPQKNVTKEKIKKVLTEPSKTGSKVAVKKRKERSVSDSEDNVLSDVPDIPSKKKHAVTKASTNVPDIPLDNIYLHYASNVIQWKYVYQRGLALERELTNDALECQEIMKLIKSAGLLKTVTHFSKCYEMLVKEFIVNLSQDCADGKAEDFHKVYVRRKCIEFSPTVVNLYLGRDDEAQPELEVTDNEVCKVITGGKVKKY
ncbi:uncharacterized protein LOC131597105 [Vicia villosa]|uniref:uncharacterized protein LOC131597105 n=1 Tax=Vicia villosa TaxID=3911 RepID=UPI00273A87D5|nr:uncharacterized protein LOC131597105 [Vicia villosa]